MQQELFAGNSLESIMALNGQFTDVRDAMKAAHPIGYTFIFKGDYCTITGHTSNSNGFKFAIQNDTYVGRWMTWSMFLMTMHAQSVIGRDECYAIQRKLARY